MICSIPQRRRPYLALSPRVTPPEESGQWPCHDHFLAIIFNITAIRLNGRLPLFIAAQDKELLEWVSRNVTFPNSMVDRITPATTPADIERLNRKNGTEDEAPSIARILSSG